MRRLNMDLSISMILVKINGMNKDFIGSWVDNYNNLKPLMAIIVT